MITKSSNHIIQKLTIQSDLVVSITKALKKYNYQNYVKKQGNLWKVEG